jgi:subtilisin family serine protease
LQTRFQRPPMPQLPRRRASALAALLLGGSLAALSMPGARPVAAQGEAIPPHVPGEIIIQFKAESTPGQRQEALQRAAAHGKRAVLTGAMKASGVSGLTVAGTNGSVAAAARALANHPAVEFAEPNWVYTHSAVATDTYFTNGSLWGMYAKTGTPANQYGSQAAAAWAAGHTGSSQVYVGVIDEGIDVSHPDLAANVWENPYDPAGDSDGDGNADDDGNGYADDTHGWDFFQGNNSVYDGAAGDTETDAHGTHVSGTIGAQMNGLGVVGVCWSVTLISGKFLGPNGGTLEAAVKAFDYFTDLKTRHNLNIVATNNSWGGGGYSAALHAAINRAAKAGILCIAAAGNSGRNNDMWASYPANYNTTLAAGGESAATYDAVISVAAIDSKGGKASFSNYGAKNVDLGAPGVGIWSSTPNRTLSRYDGTSMATPHVTGGAALYAASLLLPGGSTTEADAAAIKAAILSSATQTKSLDRKVATNGRLNVAGF